MDAQSMDGEWSVEKVLQVIIINCRSWRGEGMKVGTKLLCSHIYPILALFYMLILCFFLPPSPLSVSIWQMFPQLHFTYEQESHPEEFFIPYVWQLVISRRYVSCIVFVHWLLIPSWISLFIQSLNSLLHTITVRNYHWFLFLVMWPFCSIFSFNPSNLNLFPVGLPAEVSILFPQIF